MSKILLIDGDILLYKAGFSVESRQYRVVTPDGHKEVFKDRRTAMAYYDKHPGSSLYFDKTAEPIQNSKANLDRIIARAVKNSGCTGYTVYLSSEDKDVNYRYKAAKTRPYKGNRSDDAKPIHYGELRRYLIKKHRTEIANRGEGDDALGRAQTENTVIASIDKDMLMVPGLHFNLNTHQVTVVKQPGRLILKRKRNGQKTLTGYGFKWFCAQMMLGDHIDNIPGLPGYGPVKAHNTLKDCVTCSEMWNTTVKHYIKKKAEDRLDEIRTLLWIEHKVPFEDYINDNNS